VLDKQNVHFSADMNSFLVIIMGRTLSVVAGVERGLRKSIA